MKDWWNNLALREKQILCLGSLALLGLLVYLFVWAPLDTSVTDLRKKITRNQELLTWMQNADKRIQTLESAATPTVPSTHSPGSLLTVVQKQINRTPLVSTLKQLHQTDNDSVQLTFQKVEFDQLIKWLMQVSQLEGLQVSQMNIVPTDKVGIVDTSLILKNG